MPLVAQTPRGCARPSAAALQRDRHGPEQGVSCRGLKATGRGRSGVLSPWTLAALRRSAGLDERRVARARGGCGRPASSRVTCAGESDHDQRVTDWAGEGGRGTCGRVLMSSRPAATALCLGCAAGAVGAGEARGNGWGGSGDVVRTRRAGVGRVCSGAETQRRQHARVARCPRHAA